MIYQIIESLIEETLINTWNELLKNDKVKVNYQYFDEIILKYIIAKLRKNMFNKLNIPIPQPPKKLDHPFKFFKYETKNKKETKNAKKTIKSSYNLRIAKQKEPEYKFKNLDNYENIKIKSNELLNRLEEFVIDDNFAYYILDNDALAGYGYENTFYIYDEDKVENVTDPKLKKYIKKFLKESLQFKYIISNKTVKHLNSFIIKKEEKKVKKEKEKIIEQEVDEIVEEDTEEIVEEVTFEENEEIIYNDEENEINFNKDDYTLNIDDMEKMGNDEEQ